MRIPDYPVAAKPLDGTEVLPVWSGGSQHQITINDILAMGTNPNADLALRANLAANGGAALVGTSSGITVEADLDSIFGTNLGTVPSGSSQQLTQQRIVTGALDGTSIFYGRVSRVQTLGANAFAEVRTDYCGLDIDGSGPVTTAIGEHRYVWIGGSGNVANLRAYEGHLRADNSGGVTSTAIIFNIATPTFNSGTGVINKLVGFGCADMGDATRVLTAVGIEIPDFTSGPTLSVAFWGQTTPGDNKYALYMDGGANNYLSGALGIGTLAPDALLHVRKDLDGIMGPIIQNRNATGTPIAGLRFISGVNDLVDNRYAAILSSGGVTCDLEFWVSNAAAPFKAWTINSQGGLIPQALGGPSANGGFLRIQTIAGAPTSTPTSISGTAPVVGDTTNNKVWFNFGGVWKGVAVA